MAVTDGKTAGTSGRSLRVEGMTFELLDAKGKRVNGIRYRSHVQNYGWQDWVKNGENAGSSGRSLRVEAIQVVLCKKGEAAPSSNGSVSNEAFIDGSSVVISAHC